MRRVLSCRLSFVALVGLLGCQSAPTASYRNRPLDEWLEDLAAAETPQRVNAARAVGSMESLGEPALPALSAALESGPLELRVAAADALGSIGARAGTAALVLALEDPVARVRRSAAESLGRLKAPAATAPLLGLLEHDPDRWVQRAAGNALGAIGAPACSVVVALLERGDLVLKERAARALGRMGSGAKAAVPALIRSLDDRWVQQHAARALGGIGDEAAPAVPALVALLTGKNAPWARRRAAEALGRIGKSALPSLVVALTKTDLFVRIHGARALGAMREDGVDAAHALCWLLSDDRREVREEAAHALREIGKPAVPALTKALVDLEDEIVVQEACNILGDLGDEAEASVPALIALLSAPNSDSWVRVSAANALGSMGTVARPAIPSLHKIIGSQWPSRDWLIRGEAAEALAEIDDLDAKGKRKRQAPAPDDPVHPGTEGRVRAPPAVRGRMYR